MSKLSQVVKKTNYWFIDLINELKFHTLSIIFILFLYILFWFVPQINDLIVVIIQDDQHWIVVGAFFSAITVFAFFVSTINFYIYPQNYEETGRYTVQKARFKFAAFKKQPEDLKESYLELKHNKTLRNEEMDDFKETQQQYIKRLFPKFLATIFLLVIVYSVNNTYNALYTEDIILLGNKSLLVLLFLLLLGLNKKLTDSVSLFFKDKKWGENLLLAVAISCFFGVLLLGLVNKGGAKSDIKILFYSLFLLSLFFFIITTSYNKWVLLFKKYIGFLLILVLIIFVLCAYLLLIYDPQAIDVITPLPIVMICVIGVYTIATIFKLIGKSLEAPVLSIVLIVCIVIGIVRAGNSEFNHYDVSTTANKAEIDPSKRLQLDAYIEQWITDREKDILTSKSKFPIILVSAEGGGSRAALWSFLVQSYLYEKDTSYFEKNLFSITGASGGGVGNNMFYTQAYRLLDSNKASDLRHEKGSEFKYKASSVFNDDYLSTSIASLMGRDLFQSLFNFGTFKDRGKLLENEWESSFNKTFNYSKKGPLAESYLNHMPQKGKYKYIRPLLITNTTNVRKNKGLAVISPVSTRSDTNNMDVFLDVLDEFSGKNSIIKQSTAMSMNARFPYLSPSARIKGVGQFGDSGYYDNIGGTVTRRLEKALKKHLDAMNISNYEIRHLLITNEDTEDEIKYVSQLISPAVMIWNATFSHPKEMERSLTNPFNIQSKRTEIVIEGDSIAPIIPLGRYLSKNAVLSLEERLENISVDLEEILK